MGIRIRIRKAILERDPVAGKGDERRPKTLANLIAGRSLKVTERGGRESLEKLRATLIVDVIAPSRRKLPLAARGFL